MLYVYGKFDRGRINPLEKTAVAAAREGIKTIAFGEADELVSDRLAGEGIATENLAPYPPDETELEEVCGGFTEKDAVINDLSGEIDATKFVLAAAKRARALTLLAFAAFAVPETVACACDAAVFTEEAAGEITGFELKTEVGVALAVAELYSVGLKSVVILLSGGGAVAAESDRITYIDEDIADGAEFAARFIGAILNGNGAEEAARVAARNDF